MIIRKADSPEINTVSSDNWINKKILLKKDGMGYSFHKNTLKAGRTTYIHYKNHF